MLPKEDLRAKVYKFSEQGKRALTTTAAVVKSLPHGSLVEGYPSKINPLGTTFIHASYISTVV